jgi:hypothetical protein
VSGTRRHRANGEGSIYPYKNGYAAYVWVTTPTGQKDRKYIYGQDREDVHDRWIGLQAKARKMPIPTKTPSVAAYLGYWLGEVIKPNREPSTYTTYEVMARLHVVPGVGSKRIDKLTVREPRHGSTSSPAAASAAPRGKTPGARKGSAAAAPSASAARITPGAALSRRRAALSAPRSTTP